MIAASILLDRIESRRCVIDATGLGADDVLVGRRAAPYLYDFAAKPDAEAVVDSVIDSTLTAMPTLAKTAGPTALREIQRFWARVLSRHAVSKSAREDVVHAYVFYFWNELRSDPQVSLFDIEESYIPQQRLTWGVDSPFSERLASRFEREAPVDIVARDGTVLYAIEVKYDTADDRCVGQLLRYFEVARHLATNVEHFCDIRAVVPVLIAREFPKENWVSLSPAFRELLQVFTFDVDSEDRMFLRDGRVQLRAALKGNRRYSY